MSKKNKTYYVKKKNSWHTYDFLEQQKTVPKWTDSYLLAPEKRQKVVAICVLSFAVAAYFLMIGIIALSLYGKVISSNSVTEEIIQVDTSLSSVEEKESGLKKESEAQSEVLSKTENTINAELENDQYYQSLKIVWQEAQNYIETIDNPELKNSVQTPEGAVNGKYIELLGQYPEDEELIKTARQRILNGE